MSHELDTQQRELIKSLCHFFDKEFTPVVEKKVGYLILQYDSKKPQRVVEKEITKQVFIRMPGTVSKKPDATPESFHKEAVKVCRRYGVTLKALRGTGRKGNLVPARVRFSEIMLDNYETSKSRIGEYLNRDHTSITYYFNSRKQTAKEIESRQKDLAVA